MLFNCSHKFSFTEETIHCTQLLPLVGVLRLFLGIQLAADFQSDKSEINSLHGDLL